MSKRCEYLLLADAYPYKRLSAGRFILQLLLTFVAELASFPPYSLLFATCQLIQTALRISGKKHYRQ